MKSRLFFLLMMLVSFNCFAESAPAIIFDNPSCDIKEWHDRGGSFQNKTGSTIVNSSLKLRQTIYYGDKRTPLVGTFEVGKFRTDYCTVVSTSAEVMRRNNIPYETSELVDEKGLIEGCKFKTTELNRVSTHLQLVLINNVLKCQQS
jgi:hypothetical protein